MAAETQVREQARLGRESGKLSAVSDAQSPLADRVYEVVHEAILTAQLEEGKRISERALAEELGVSRTPVREALQRLQTDGLLINTPDGLTVREFSIQEIIDIYELRIALESISARLAAERATYGDIAELKNLYVQMTRATSEENVDKLTRVNREFHSKMAQISANRFLVKFVNLLHDSVQRYSSTTFIDKERRERAAAEHEQLLHAIESKDVAMAEAIAGKHIADAQRTRIKLLMRS